MGRHVSWRTGGPRRPLLRAGGPARPGRFLRQLPDDEPLLFVGLGSNLLVRDGGLRGTVILMHAASRRPELRDGRIYAEAGVAEPESGALRGDARSRGRRVPGRHAGHRRRRAGDERRLLRRRDLGRRRPRRHHQPARQDGGARRATNTTSATATARRRRRERNGSPPPGSASSRGDGATSRAIMKELLARRIATQPLSLPNAGSVFRNPPKRPRRAPDRVLRPEGLRARRRRASRRSTPTSSSIRRARRSAADIEWLIRHIQRIVLPDEGRRTSRTEVRIVGEEA